MKTLLLLLLISTNTSAACYARIGVGKNLNISGASIPWEDGGSPGAILEVYCDYKLREDLYLNYGWLHDSNWLTGKPFNNRKESSVDFIGVSLVWRFYD